jgi:hypothetical protein
MSAIADDLAPQLLPKYQVLIEERIYQVENQDSILVGAPDVLVQQLRSDENPRTTTVVAPSAEPLSVTLTIRAMILSSSSNFVEIDLLRQSPPMPIQENLARSHYRILVSPEEKRPQADLYAFNLPDPIPCFVLPLRSGDQLPTINLRQLLDGIYDRSGYGLVIDYAQPAVPPLSVSDAAWVQQWMAKSACDGSL